MNDTNSRTSTATDVSEVCPHCRTSVNHGATICVGCGARKLQRGFPNGTNGFLTFCFLWLGPSALIVFLPLKEINRRPSSYDSSPPMSGGIAFALVCLGLAVFFIGLIWIRRLMARSHDIVWIR